MNKRITICLLLGLMALPLLLSAQGAPDRGKIKALKIAFITERLSLTSEEAEVFWPLYNSFEDRKEALRGRQHQEVYNKIDQVSSLSEEEARQLLQKYLAIEEEEEEIDKEFYTRIAKAISAKKTLLLFSAEHDFHKRLIKQMRGRGKE